MKQLQENEPTRIPWHPAFVEAIQMELDEYRDFLEFYPEYQLTSEPLRIDCVVIKKARNVKIQKNIAAIFREVNLLEYKSPVDYVSIADFYKVYGYACLYASLEEVPITSLTLSFVESRYPKKLLRHLRDVRKYTVEETGSGIYTVTGDIIPIQVIDSRRLSAEENLWLKGLDNNLGVREIQRVTTEIHRLGKAARIRAYFNTITKANTDSLREVYKMSRSSLTLDQFLEEVGLIAKWEAQGEARGEERKAIDIAQNLVKLGLPFETIISATSLDPEKVKALYQRS